MEERNKILTNLRMSSSKRHHYYDNDSYHGDVQPHMTVPVQSDSEDEASHDPSSHDPLLEPVAPKPSLFTSTSDVNKLPASPTSQLSM